MLIQVVVTVTEISARNEAIYASIRYYNLFWFLNFIPALINIDYIHLSFPIFLMVYPCLAFKSIWAILHFHFEH
jgi:hypothetical protein